MTHTPITLERFEIFGFLYECLLSGAVTEKELQAGIEHLIEDCDDIGLLEIYPDLIECGEDRAELLHAFRNITHVFWDSPLRLSQFFALNGIALKRGFDSFDHTPLDDKRDRMMLERYPEVEKLFRKIFPFIEF